MKLNFGGETWNIFLHICGNNCNKKTYDPILVDNEIWIISTEVWECCFKIESFFFSYFPAVDLQS